MEKGTIIEWIKSFTDGRGIIYFIYTLIFATLGYFISKCVNIYWGIGTAVSLITSFVLWDYFILLKYFKPTKKKNYVLLCIDAENVEQYRKITLLLKEPFEKNSLLGDGAIKYIIPDSIRTGRWLLKHNIFANKCLRHKFIININVVTTMVNDKEVLKFVTKINCDIDHSKGKSQDLADKLYENICGDFSKIDLKDEANQINIYGENLTNLVDIVYGITYVMLSSKSVQKLKTGKKLLENVYREIKDNNLNFAKILRNIILYSTTAQYDIIKDNGELFDVNKVDELNEYLNTYRKYNYCGVDYYILYAIYEYIKNGNIKKCKDLLNKADRVAVKEENVKISKTLVRLNKAFIFMSEKNYVGAIYQYRVAFDMYMKISVEEDPHKINWILDIESFIVQMNKKRKSLELNICLAIVYAIKNDRILMNEEIRKIEQMEKYKKLHINVKNKFDEIIEYILSKNSTDKETKT